MAPRGTENNAYAKFWGDKQRALCYVMVFSRVVNSTRGLLQVQHSLKYIFFAATSKNKCECHVFFTIFT